MAGLLIAIAGFVGGLFYSRGKADPLQSAWFDLRRAARATGRGIGNLARRIKRKAETIDCDAK